MEKRKGSRIWLGIGMVLLGIIVIGIPGSRVYGKKVSPVVVYQITITNIGSTPYLPSRWIYQADAVVGHGGDSPEHPSHFMVVHDNSHITIIEFPAGNYNAALIYVIPYQFSSATVPVTLAFRDTGHSGMLDMLVLVGTQTFVFLNDGSRFILRS